MNIKVGLFTISTDYKIINSIRIHCELLIKFSYNLYKTLTL